MAARPALLAVLLTLLALGSVLADDDFKCHQCSSDRDERCWDPEKHNLQPVECDSIEHQAKIIFQKTKNVFKDLFNSIISKGAAPNNQNFHYACLKIVTSVEGKKVVRRQCTLDTAQVTDDDGVAVPDECAAKSSYTSVCEICKTDSCNSAPGVASGTLGLLAAAFLLLKMLVL